MKDNLKWTKSKIFLIVFNCILCIAIVISAMMIVIDKSRMKNGIVYTDGEPVTTNADAQSATQSARLMCAGENLVYSSIFSQASDRANSNGYDFSASYDGIKDIIAKSDLAMVTQSSVMDDKNEPSGSPEFNSPNEILDKLIALGFDVFNQANDHIMDMGLSGAINDIALFKTKENEALLTGLDENREEMIKPHTREVNGITFSFVGITESLGGYSLSEDSDIGIFDLSDDRSSEDEINGSVKQLITNSKNASDIVCVSVHWDTDTSESTQSAIIEKLLDYGTDIIIGTGTHTLQPIEYMKNSDGEQALVMRSLGDLISAADTADELLGGIADITVTKDSAGKTTVTSAKLIPTVTQYSTDYADIKIIPFAKYTKELAASHGILQNDESFTYDYIEKYYKDMFKDTLEINY
mgnify:FL=1